MHLFRVFFPLLARIATIEVFSFLFDNSENPVILIFKNDLKNDLESQKAMPNKAHAAPKVHYHAVERVLGDAVGQCDP